MNALLPLMMDIFEVFQTTLEEDLDKMRASPSKEIFLALLHADRPEDEEIDEAGLADDARNLYQKQLTWIQLVSHRRLILSRRKMF